MRKKFGWKMVSFLFENFVASTKHKLCTQFCGEKIQITDIGCQMERAVLHLIMTIPAK